jgi:hypothetical protein
VDSILFVKLLCALCITGEELSKPCDPSVRPHSEIFKFWDSIGGASPDDSRGARRTIKQCLPFALKFVLIVGIEPIHVIK